MLHIVRLLGLRIVSFNTIIVKSRFNFDCVELITLCFKIINVCSKFLLTKIGRCLTELLKNENWEVV